MRIRVGGVYTQGSREQGHTPTKNASCVTIPNFNRVTGRMDSISVSQKAAWSWPVSQGMTVSQAMI
jgi:hypothetical protein